MVAIIDKRAGLLGLYPTGKHRPEKPLEPITVIVPEGWRWNEQRREWDVTPEARLKHGRGMAQRSLLLRESVRLAPLRAYGSSVRRVTERHDQDMRVLSALVELLDAGERPAVPFPVDGLIAEQVTNSVRRLTLASPPYFTGPRSAAFDYPIRITAMTERGLVEGGIWPRTEDAYVAQLLQLLRAVEQEAPNEQRGPMRKALGYLTADGRAVATSVAAALITGGQICG